VFINHRVDPGVTQKSVSTLSFRNKPSLAGDLNAKNPVWNSQVSNPSGEELLELFEDNDFHTSMSQGLDHYTLQETGDVFDTMLHKNVLQMSLSLINWIMLGRGTF
jgi:hypothetical protein